MEFEIRSDVYDIQDGIFVAPHDFLRTTDGRQLADAVGMLRFYVDGHNILSLFALFQFHLPAVVSSHLATGCLSGADRNLGRSLLFEGNLMFLYIYLLVLNNATNHI